MKGYPFHELDYLTRLGENGYELVMSYLTQPTIEHMKALKSGVRWEVVNFIDDQLWDRLETVARLECDLSQKVSYTFECCFGLAFWDIKKQWYKFDEQGRESTKERIEHTLNKCVRDLQHRANWQDYEADFNNTWKQFLSRLEYELPGYVGAEREKRQPVPEHNENMALTEQAVVSTFRNSGLRANVFERAVFKLYDELMGGNFIADNEGVRGDFLGIFAGRLDNRINWLGNIGQLTYLIRRLSSNGLYGVNLISHEYIC